MRPPPDWNESDLLELIRLRASESLALEYKASDALGQSDGKKNELSKDVSAFANSAGGTIVYGIVEDGHVPTSLDSGCDKDIISKEWLEQVLNSKIQRRIDGISINQVDLVTTSPGRVAYVISVPQSQRAPHQAADRRFYKRFNFQSVPMEEYEIRDVARRAETPNLSLRPSLLSAIPHVRDQEDLPSACAVQLAFSISNHASTPANYAVLNVYIDERLELQISSELRGARNTDLQCDGQNVTCKRFQINYGIPGKLPIFQGVSFSLFERPLYITVPAHDRYVIGYDVIAPGMAGPVLGAAFLSWDGTEASLVEVPT